MDTNIYIYKSNTLNDDNDNMILFENPEEGIKYDNQSLTHDRLKSVANEAIILSGVTDRLTICFCEVSNGKFKINKLQNADPGHLSVGTAIDLDTIYVWPRDIRRWAFHSPDNLRKMKDYINEPEINDFDEVVLAYITMILGAGIKRFAGKPY